MESVENPYALLTVCEISGWQQAQWCRGVIAYLKRCGLTPTEAEMVKTFRNGLFPLTAAREIAKARVRDGRLVPRVSGDYLAQVNTYLVRHGARKVRWSEVMPYCDLSPAETATKPRRKQNANI